MEEHRSPSHTNPAVNAAGSAKERSSGPAFGGVDIGESEGGYFLRVAMPGAMRDEGTFPKTFCLHIVFELRDKFKHRSVFLDLNRGPIVFFIYA